MNQYFLLFQNSKKRYWWNLFTRPNFEHVDLLIYNNNSKIMSIITGDLNGISFENFIIEDNIYSALKKLSKSDILIIETLPEENIANKLIIASCVGIAKRFLGIRNRFIFTPYQLYKYLEKKGKLL